MQSMLDTKSLTVLICDDKEELLKEMVKFLGFLCGKVLSAKDGDEGYRLFLEYKNEIDVIITDIKMPKLDGLGLARYIRDIDGLNKQIIMISAFDDPTYIKDAVSLNITRFLTKPLDNDLLVGMLKEIVMIKHQKQHQNELKELLELTDDYIYISKTDTKGVINYVSSAFCKVSGYTKDELIGKPHNVVRHPDMPKEAFANMWATISSGKVWQGEVKNLKKNGDFYWVQATVSPMIENDTIVGYKSIRVDITTKKELEILNKELEERVESKVNAIREKDEMLQSQSRNALMGEMISMIAHQWRQPLSTISLLINDINMKYHLNTLNGENLKIAIDKSNQTIQYMSKTIDDFREFFKPNKSKEGVCVAKCINEAISFIEPLIKKYNIILQKDIVSDRQIFLYKNELLQVIINIIKNAIDALVETNTQSPTIKITLKDEINYKIISFEDNAGGIQYDIIHKIFEPYFSTKKKNGTGLGLYMSKTIIEDHLFGTIEAKNGTEGAIFIIQIPFEEGNVNE